ncbi:hypothetical protein [Burkholderia pyrrocinia]|uniref:hypothetical protein n=1 Tax=Burkholderia pyrrocinia TaxID=60550 RepID=UPI00158C32D9|nr:hypothetical protein [Burkholderia pyrrocinia]
MVSGAPIPGLEQKCRGRIQIREIVGSSHHHFGTRSLERRIPLAGSPFARSRFDHLIDPPTFSCTIESPKLHDVERHFLIVRQFLDNAGAGSVELRIAECLPESAEVFSQNREFQIAMFERPGAVPKIEGPSSDDAPGHTNLAQSLSGYGRLPCIPCALIGDRYLSIQPVGMICAEQRVSDFPGKTYDPDGARQL